MWGKTSKAGALRTVMIVLYRIDWYDVKVWSIIHMSPVIGLCLWLLQITITPTECALLIFFAFQGWKIVGIDGIKPTPLYLSFQSGAFDHSDMIIRRLYAINRCLSSSLLRGYWHLTEKNDLRLWTRLNPWWCMQFFNPGFQKNQQCTLNPGKSNLNWPHNYAYGRRTLLGLLM